MQTIKVKPVEFIGACQAKITWVDEFQIKGTNLENPQQSNLCLLALGHFPPVVKQLQRGGHFYAHVSCPDCISRLDREHRVVFLLGHADKWELCQAISDYRRLCQQIEVEPEAAKQLRLSAAQDQANGDYLQATEHMQAAVEVLEQAVTL